MRLRNKKRSGSEQYARSQINDGIQNRDATPWHLFRNQAGYTPDEARIRFGRLQEEMARDPAISETVRQHLLRRANELIGRHPKQR